MSPFLRLNARRFAAVALPIVLLQGCQHEDQDAEPVKNVKFENLMTLDFPAGSISSTEVTATKGTDPQVMADFSELAPLYGVTKVLPYYIVVNIGKEPPTNDSVKITINIPQDFKSTLTAGNGIQLFSKTVEDGGDETIDAFTIIETSYSSAAQTLTANLPRYVFSKARTSDQSYEAIFTLAATPGENLDGGRRAANGARVTSDCLASSISCPLGSYSECTGKIGSPYGLRTVNGEQKMHRGVDFPVPEGTPIYAAEDGKVIMSGTNPSYGKVIGLKHSSGNNTTLYAHLSSLTVANGTVVKAGQQIGLSGNTGSASRGAHLHFEYIPNGALFGSNAQIDPFPCISDGLASGSITVADNGNWADDSFEASIDGIVLGTTDIGASNSMAANNLRPGEKTLSIKCLIAPDNEGTYEVILQDELTFKGGSSYMTGVLAEGEVISWTIIVPKKSGGRLAFDQKPFRSIHKPNPYKESSGQ